MGIYLAVGWLAGALGVLVSVIAAGTRLAGNFWIAGFQAGTVMQAGIALMLVGVLGFLAALTSQRAISNR